jgi:hypothetical protein
LGNLCPVPTADSTSELRTYPYVFYFGPFRFESEIDIPELRTSTSSGERDVTIRLGGVPRDLDGGIPYDEYCQVAPTEFLLDIPNAARYYVRNGNEVRLEIASGASSPDVSTFLLGSIFGVLCHQNGLLPLHASAVECGGDVSAFLGNSGAGKSTLAACLQRRRYRIVSDDICLLETDAAALRVVPVAGWLKLWNQSLHHLGQTPVEQNRIYSKQDKYRIYLPETDAQRPRLARVVFLAKDPDSQAQPTLQPLPLVDAIAGLMDMTYVGYVPSLTGRQSTLFQQCARVFQYAQAWRLTVPWGLDRMDSVLDLLEREFFHSRDAKL